MIRVTVELLPKGDRQHPVHLGTALITNDATGRAGDAIGNYNVTLSIRGRPQQVWKSGRVEGFPRKRLGGWDLLYRALRDIVGERNR